MCSRRCFNGRKALVKDVLPQFGVPERICDNGRYFVDLITDGKHY